MIATLTTQENGPKKRVENISFLSVNSKKNAKEFEKSAKISKPQNWGQKKNKKKRRRKP
jgi:hypothetical protein